MEKTKIGVIGLGGIAQLVHLPIISKLKNASILAVAELNKTRLNAIADKFNIEKRFTDYKQMLALEDLEAIIIATPTHTHLEIATDCIKAGKDVLIEKPIARNYEETKKINDIAAKTGSKVMVGTNLRFRPDAMLLKSLINSGELGEIYYIRCSWLRKQSSKQKWFIRKNESGGGAIIDLGLSLLDLAIWLIDYPPIKSVTVQKFNHFTKTVEDSAVGLIRLNNSFVINFEISWSLHSEKDSLGLTAFGTEGTAHLNPLVAYRRVGAAHIDYTTSSATNTKTLYKKSYENELKHFIGAVRGNNPLLSSSSEALRRMKLLEALYKSAELNSEVLVEKK